MSVETEIKYCLRVGAKPIPKGLARVNVAAMYCTYGANIFPFYFFYRYFAPTEQAGRSPGYLAKAILYFITCPPHKWDGNELVCPGRFSLPLTSVNGYHYRQIWL
jgi:hypothetical protein